DSERIREDRILFCQTGTSFAPPLRAGTVPDRKDSVPYAYDADSPRRCRLVPALPPLGRRSGRRHPHLHRAEDAREVARDIVALRINHESRSSRSSNSYFTPVLSVPAKIRLLPDSVETNASG